MISWHVEIRLSWREKSNADRLVARGRHKEWDSKNSRRYRLPKRKVCSREINNRWSFRILTFHLPFTKIDKKRTEQSSTDREYKVSNGVRSEYLVLARDLRCLQGLQAKWMHWFLREYLRALCTCRIWTNYPPHFRPIRAHKSSPRDTFMFILCTFPIF